MSRKSPEREGFHDRPNERRAPISFVLQDASFMGLMNRRSSWRSVVRLASALGPSGESLRRLEGSDCN